MEAARPVTSMYSPPNPPGLGEPVGFGLYSGYVTVDEAAGRALFYILAESTASPSTDPLVLWLKRAPLFFSPP